MYASEAVVSSCELGNVNEVWRYCDHHNINYTDSNIIVLLGPISCSNAPQGVVMVQECKS